MFIKLNDLICKSFKSVITSIINCDVDRAVLKGGRSSTKSQCVSESIIIGCMVNKSSAVCMVKHANKIEERLVNTFRESIRFLNVEKWWKLRRSPFEYVLLDRNGKETAISIKFTGCDDAESLKSYKPRQGSFRYIWFEELTNFNGINEINNIVQTMARGEGKHCTIMTYNPPMSTSNWVNKEFDVPCGKVIGYDSNLYEEEIEIHIDGIKKIIKQIVHHSTYLDVIESGHSNWLGLTFIGQAEQSKINNTIYYEWAYLGKVVGTDANVFRNIADWTYTNEINITSVDRGLDCSNGGADPWMYGSWFYDKPNNDLYCLDEFCLSGKSSIGQVAINLKQKNKNNYEFFIDGAVPTFASLLSKEGLNPIKVKKGPDSIMAGILWLKSLNHIYIDKMKCPITYKEFKGYEYLIDKDDNITSQLKDKDNHSIDACRYALCYKIKYDW